MKNNVTEKYIEELISQLTVDEKIGLVHGTGLFNTQAVERLDIPEMWYSDGPMGVRMEFADAKWHPNFNNDDYVTYLPCNSAVASTWNRELARSTGSVLGQEARGRGKDVILAPGINIKRSPLCGRNFEYVSEDPRLIEEMVVPMVQGIQSQDVAACVKHFAANSQETNRLSVDTIVDERTLREIYFPGFKAAIEKGGLFTLMGAYNKLNGEFCCMSESLLNKVLRDEWGFDGLIVSDWGGVHDTEEAYKSALDVEMDVRDCFDDYYMAKPLADKIKSGELSEEPLNEKVRNVLRTMVRLKMIGVNKDARSVGAFNTKEHQQRALETARESLILLKNEDKVLPLAPKKGCKIAVIGANGATMHANGGGSAEIRALYEVTPLMGIKMLLGGDARIKYAPGYYVPKKVRPEISWQADSTKSEEELAAQVQIVEDPVAAEEKRIKYTVKYYEEAVALAKESDIVIYVGGLNHGYDVEGLDRGDMKLPYEQDKLIEAILDVKPDTVVVMYAGSPVEMPWLPRTKAVLWSYFAGMEGGNAIAEVLFGRVNPSGKLAETFIKDESQCPARTGVNFAMKETVEHTEGVMVGYRHYDTVGTDVNFCFGHGLSYTSFEYSNLNVTMKDDKLSGQLDAIVVELSFDITNTGDVAGSEIAQIYVAPKTDCGLVRPSHELKAFDKIYLQPGETKKVTVLLAEKDFSCYDIDTKSFVKMAGQYELQIGASARDIRLTQTIAI